jgi:hypothetical protein
VDESIMTPAADVFPALGLEAIDDLANIGLDLGHHRAPCFKRYFRRILKPTRLRKILRKEARSGD